MVQGDSRNSPIIPEIVSHSANWAAGTIDEKGSSGTEESGLLLLLYLGCKNRRAGWDSFQICTTNCYWKDRRGSGVGLPARLVYVAEETHFFHLSIISKHRKFLCSSFQGNQNRPFCRTLAPSTCLFTTLSHGRGLLCLHRACHTSCVKPFHRQLSRLARHPQRVLGATPPWGTSSSAALHGDISGRHAAASRSCPCSFIHFNPQHVPFFLCDFWVFCHNEPFQRVLCLLPVSVWRWVSPIMLLLMRNMSLHFFCSFKLYCS